MSTKKDNDTSAITEKEISRAFEQISQEAEDILKGEEE